LDHSGRVRSPRTRLVQAQVGVALGAGPGDCLVLSMNKPVRWVHSFHWVSEHLNMGIVSVVQRRCKTVNRPSCQ
jgi:hypothetical protein